MAQPNIEENMEQGNVDDAPEENVNPTQQEAILVEDVRSLLHGLTNILQKFVAPNVSTPLSSATQHRHERNECRVPERLLPQAGRGQLIVPTSGRGNGAGRGTFQQRAPAAIQNQNGKGQVQGRVYAMSMEETENSQDVVTGLIDLQEEDLSQEHYTEEANFEEVEDTGTDH